MIARFSLVILTCVLGGGSYTYAGGCYGRPVYYYNYTPSYVAPVVKKILVAETVILPTFVPSATFINTLPPSSPATVTISPAYMAQQQQAAALQARQQVEGGMNARLERIEKALAGLSRLPAATVATTAESSEDLPPAAGIPPQEPAVTTTTTSTTAATPVAAGGLGADFIRAAGILNQRCAQCHTGEKARGGLSFFDAAGGLDLRNTSWDEILTACTKPGLDGLPKMPKGPVKLTEEEKQVIALVARSSRPQTVLGR